MRSHVIRLFGPLLALASLALLGAIYFVSPGSFGYASAGAIPQVSTTIAISEFRTAGPAGAQDEFVELYNLAAVPINLSGWKINHSDNGGLVENRVTVQAGTVISPFGHFLAANLGYTGGVPADQTFSENLANDGGIAVLDADGDVVDQVGMSLGSAYREGTPLLPRGQFENASYERRPGGGLGNWQDSDDNPADFRVVYPSNPQNLHSAPVPPVVPTPTRTPTGTMTPTATITPVPTVTRTPENTATSTRTPTRTTTVTPSPQSPSPSSTRTPGSHTPTPTRTVSPTPSLTRTASPTPTPAPDVKIFMLYAHTLATPAADEAIRLINIGGATADLDGWQIYNGQGTIDFGSGATLDPGESIWIADQATMFGQYFGFTPDYEYAADTDPTVPNLTASPGYALADAGGFLQVRSGSGEVVDALKYGDSTASIAGWSGPALPYYSGGSNFEEAGQIFYRRLEETSGEPVEDTDAAPDWAQDNASGSPGVDTSARKLLRPGWATTQPSYYDMFRTSTFTETGVTTKFLVAPDNIYDPVRSLILSATRAISIETYEWTAAPLVPDIINAKNRGVNVTVALDGDPVGGVDVDTLWAAAQWEGAGIPVYFFSGGVNAGGDQYRYNNVHAKMMIVDGTWLATGSENFSSSSMPSDPKGNGTRGHRGTFVITNAPRLVAYASRLFAFDVAPGRYVDLVEYPALGTPPPGYTPTPLPDYTSYLPVKPTPLVVTETEAIEIVQAPETALRTTDSLLGLVNRAGSGDEVLVRQQYERTYWQTSVTFGANPRLEAYISAAERGATVRILLDAAYDNCGARNNSATVAYVNGLGLPNLQARIAAPTGDSLHDKSVLVRINGRGTAHISSINGSENSSKANREFGLQIASDAAYLYYKDVFNYDWSLGYVGTCFPTVTPTRSPTATTTGSATNTATRTRTSTPTATEPPSPKQLLISEFRTRGPLGGNDEFVEIYNPLLEGVSIGGWSIWGSTSEGSVGSRLVITEGTTIPAHGHFLAANDSFFGYSGTVEPDQRYRDGIIDDGGIALLDPYGRIVDAVGLSLGSAYLEGAPLDPLTVNTDQGYERLPGGLLGNGQDTGNNFVDFALIAPTNPQNLHSAPAPPLGTPTATGTATATRTRTVTPSSTRTPTVTRSPTLTPTSTRSTTPGPTATRTRTPTATLSATRTPTQTVTRTPTTGPTSSPTPAGQALLVGHVNWQGRPAQPNALQQIPITLTLRSATTEVNYPTQATDASGFFTVSVASLATGTYTRRAKGSLFLAESGSVTLTGIGTVQSEMGTMRAGDCNDDNRVNIADFNILKGTFGKTVGDPGYDARAELNGDGRVNASDFNLLRGNFGLGGAPPVGPAP